MQTHGVLLIPVLRLSLNVLFTLMWYMATHYRIGKYIKGTLMCTFACTCACAQHAYKTHRPHLLSTVYRSHIKLEAKAEGHWDRGADIRNGSDPTAFISLSTLTLLLFFLLHPHHTTIDFPLLLSPSLHPSITSRQYLPPEWSDSVCGHVSIFCMVAKMLSYKHMNVCNVRLCVQYWG